MEDFNAMLTSIRNRSTMRDCMMLDKVIKHIDDLEAELKKEREINKQQENDYECGDW